MIHDDLFRELDDVARDYGWTRPNPSEMRIRTYEKVAPSAEGVMLHVTISIYANRPGTAITRASRGITAEGKRPIGVSLDSTYPGKRDQVILWLRWAGEDRRS